ncbi:IS256 family transposase ISCbo4 [Terrisporobacter petrolearius]
MDDLTGKNGLMKKLIQDMMQHLLEVEMEEHLGREKYERNDDIDKNYRNGHKSKNIRTSYGDVNVSVPRDRNAEFEPKVIKKYEIACNDLDNKVISLYARGLTVSDIRAELGDLYGIDISESMVSKITDKVMANADEWQNRMLDSVYPIVFMDAIHYKVRQDGKIVNKAAYVCMGIDMEGYKDILGIWIGENESAKFWLSACNNLINRGVSKILIACMDGLKGLPEAILSVYPKYSSN